MLRYFFDIGQPENKKLFAELDIWKCEDVIKEKQGKYPVIYLSFKDVKKDGWENCYLHIRSVLVKLYGKHRYLLNANVLYEDEIIKYKKILTENARMDEYEKSLALLSEYLYRYYKQKVVVLIDEYDTPIQASYNKFYDEAISFMRTLFSGAFKDNDYLYKGVITGILRVSRESIFTGLNNISVHSILDDEFSDKFGFTELEVKQLLRDFNTKTDYTSIKKWYDGYKIGETENLYNPWSILNFIVSKNETFKTYWANTSSDELIKTEIQNKNADYVRGEIVKLIAGESIIKDLEPNFIFPDLQKRKTLLWTLLAYSGYLTINRKASLYDFELRIPNREIKIIFQRIILEWFETGLNVIKSTLSETTNNLINNKIEKFEQGFRQIIGDTFSYFDSSKSPEFAYQSYVLGLLALIGDDYIIKSNRESGEGRYDIMLIPHDKTKYGIVIEIKQTEKQSDNETNEQFVARINEMLNRALLQIESKGYYKELIDNKIKKEKIIKLPIVFAGKTPYITKTEIKK